MPSHFVDLISLRVEGNDGGRVADTDLNGLSIGELEVALSGLRAWTELKAKGNSRVSAVTLAPALRILGIEADGDASSSLSGGSDRRWLDLVGVRRTGKALVPAFGSGSGSRLRLLCCWSSPDPSTLVAQVAQDRLNVRWWCFILERFQAHSVARSLQNFDRMRVRVARSSLSMTQRCSIWRRKEREYLRR